MNCEFDCKGKCTSSVFGIEYTDWGCYNACLDAERLCDNLKKSSVINTAGEIVAKNLTLAFIMDPVAAAATFQIYLKYGDIQFPPIEFNPVIPDTDVSIIDTVDCLYVKEVGGRKIFWGISKDKPAQWDNVKIGDKLSLTGSNSKCEEKEGQQLISTGSFKYLNKAQIENVYSYFGSGEVSIAENVAFTRKLSADSLSNEVIKLIGVVEDAGENIILSNILPSQIRRIVIPKENSITEASGYSVTINDELRELVRVDVIRGTQAKIETISAIEDIFSQAANTKKSKAKGCKCSSIPAVSESTSLIEFYGNYPGDIACAVAKASPVYWQVYALVKLAKDNGYLVSGDQCNDVNYTAAVIASLSGAGEPVFIALLELFGGCICWDLF